MRRTETKLLLEYLEWDTLADRCKLSKITLFYKIMRKQTPPYLFRNLSINQPPTRNLRNANEIKPPRCRLELYKKSFFPNCLAIWNTLPNFIKKIPKHSIIQKRHKNPLEYWDPNTEQKLTRSHSWRFIWKNFNSD